MQGLQQQEGDMPGADQRQVQLHTMGENRPVAAGS
jgi:hypothetical protein